MRKFAYAVLGAALLFSANIAFADNSVAPLSFYCDSYTEPFVSGGLYTPDGFGTACYYNLPPIASSSIEMTVYQGVPGGATPISFHSVGGNGNASSTSITQGTTFGAPADGTNFFAVAYGFDSFSEVFAADSYFQNGGGVVPVAYNILQFVWGIPPVTDTDAPVIAITTPANGNSYLQNDYVSVAASITDASEIVTTTYKLNGAVIDSNVALPLMSQPLGAATLVVSATDSEGNTGYATSTFTLLAPDLTAPTVVINNPVQGATYMDTASVIPSATITDASAIGAVSYIFNGTSVDPLLPLPFIGAPLGSATLSVAATDIYGNAASTTVTFSIISADVTPPSITITNPVAGQTYLSSQSVLAAATITDASGIASKVYTLDGIEIDPLLPLPLAAAGTGPALLVVTATDNFANTASSSVAFTISAPPPPDTTGPTVVIVSPQAGKKYSRNMSVMVVANITDASSIADVRYLFNGVEIDPTKKLNFSKAPLGNATVSVIATDSFGNVGSSTVKFRILPGSNSCIEDITEAFDRKWIANKNVFRSAFEDCKKMHDREHDRDDYDRDNRGHGRNSWNDDRYLRCQRDIDDAFESLDRKINN